MQRFAWSLFAAALLLSAALVVTTEGQLPSIVATHFGSGGVANGWMPHDRYLLAMVATVIGVPLAIVAATTWLPRLAPGLLKLDRCKRWADPSARPRILASTATFGAIEASIVAIFVAAVHLCVVAANEAAPPRLDMSTFVPIVIAFVTLTVGACLVHTHATRRA